MGAAFVSQQFLQNVLGYSTLEAGRRVPAGGRVHGRSSRRARPSSSRPAAPASRCCRLRVPAARASLTMLLLWKEGSPVLAGRPRLRVHRDRRRLRRARPPRTRSPARCPCAAPAWRRARPTSSATSAARSCSRSSARCSPPATPPRSPRRSRPRRDASRSPTSVAERAHEVVLRARRTVAQQYPQYSDADHRRGEVVVPRRRHWAYTAGIVAVAARRGARLLHVPEGRTRSSSCWPTTTPQDTERRQRRELARA